MGVLEENGLGSINKEELLKNEPPKGDTGGIPANVFRVVPCLGGRFILLSPSS